MASLFPVFKIPSIAVLEKKTEQIYGRSLLFDFENGDFVINGANKAVYGSGYDAWVLWCTKTLLTQRLAHDAYSTAIGIEAAEAFLQPDRKAQESAFERTITEALLADPMGRTLQVNDFTFSWFGDGLEISCSVSGTDGSSAAITAKLDT